MNATDVRLSPIEDGILAVNGHYPDFDMDVRALLVHGTNTSLLIDTLARPQDLEPVRAEMAERGNPLWIVNSHADWDHWWGNAAFPTAPVFATRAAAERQRREARRSLASMRRSRPALFDGVDLRAATVAFEGILRLSLGGLTVELHPLRGHTHDQVVAWLPERRLLFAADAAEGPIPLVTEGPITGWPDALEGWAQRAGVVVPAHGAVSGPELLERNAAYLRALLADTDMPLPSTARTDPFYSRAHRRNLKRCAAERAAMSSA